ncbi:MAG: type II toxin-antitoxin system VapB family antitoxin [Mucilaginibacter sp.]
MEAGTREKKRIAKLPENLKLKAERYIDALLDEAKKTANTNPKTEVNGNRGYGSLKGKIWMSEDFNEPLEDFKDYM